MILIGMAWAHVFYGYNATNSQVTVMMGASVLESLLDFLMVGVYITWKEQK